MTQFCLWYFKKGRFSERERAKGKHIEARWLCVLSRVSPVSIANLPIGTGCFRAREKVQCLYYRHGSFSRSLRSNGDRMLYISLSFIFHLISGTCSSLWDYSLVHYADGNARMLEIPERLETHFHSCQRKSSRTGMLLFYPISAVGTARVWDPAGAKLDLVFRCSTTSCVGARQTFVSHVENGYEWIYSIYRIMIRACRPIPNIAVNVNSAKRLFDVDGPCMATPMSPK